MFADSSITRVFTHSGGIRVFADWGGGGGGLESLQVLGACTRDLEYVFADSSITR